MPKLRAIDILYWTCHKIMSIPACMHTGVGCAYQRYRKELCEFSLCIWKYLPWQYFLFSISGILQKCIKVPKVCKVKGILYTFVRFPKFEIVLYLGEGTPFLVLPRFLGPASSYIALGKTLKSKSLNATPSPIVLAIPWGHWFMAKSKKLQEMSLDMQLNSQDILGYTMLAKRVFLHIHKTLKNDKKIIHKLMN